MPFATTRTDLAIITPSEVSQKEKDKYHMISLMQNLKRDTNEHIYRNDSDVKNRLLVAEGEKGQRRGGWEFGNSRCELPYIE